MEKKYILGIDIGGTKIALALSDRTGQILQKSKIDNKDTLFAPTLEAIKNISLNMLNAAGGNLDELLAVGVSAPGEINFADGILVAPCNNPLWSNIPIVAELKKAFKTDVLLENDANSAALAEGRFGAAKGESDFIYLTMSTGIGGGIVAGGKLLRGKFGQGGEVGHIIVEPEGRLCGCKLHGCWEAYSGGRQVALRAQEELCTHPESSLLNFATGGEIKNIDMIAIEKAVRAEDKFASGIWLEMSRRNAQGIGSLINMLNPGCVVLGTLAWACGDLFMKPLLEMLPAYSWASSLKNCRVVPGELRSDIGYYAGIAAAMNFLDRDRI